MLSPAAVAGLPRAPSGGRALLSEQSAKLAESTKPNPKPALQISQPHTPKPKPPRALRQARKVPPVRSAFLAGAGARSLASVGLLAESWATGSHTRVNGITYAGWATFNHRGRALHIRGICLSKTWIRSGMSAIVLIQDLDKSLSIDNRAYPRLG